MRPIRLMVENFQSYRGSHELALEGISLAVLSGPNGSGKSSLIDAIRYALWGTTRAGADSAVSEGENLGRVEFQFALGEDVYLVSRQRSRKGGGSTTLTLQQRSDTIGEPGDNVTGAIYRVLDGKTIQETQGKIEGLLHMTDDLFTQTACSNQGNAAAFSQAKPVDRKKVLGEILDLGEWERRADLARTLGRDLQARVETQREQQQQAERQANEADSIRAQAGEVNQQIAAARSGLVDQQAHLADAQERREGLVRAREADQAQRKALSDLTAQRQRVAGEVLALGQRRTVTQQAVAHKPEIEAEVAEAQAARIRADELETLRQQDQGLAHEIEVLEATAKAAIAQHQGEVRRLREAIAGAEREHRHQVQAFEAQISQAKEGHAREVIAATKEAAALQIQAEALDEVPCQRIEPAALTPEQMGALKRECPLLAGARTARAELPDALGMVQALEEARPWGEAQAELTALQATPEATAEHECLALLEQTDPAAAERALQQDLARRRIVIGYNADAHAQAKRAAAGLEDAHRRLSDIGRAEAQLGEIEAAWTERQAEQERLEQREAALTEELGPERNWGALIGTTEGEATVARRNITRIESEVATLHARAGALEEQAARAAQAAEEAERLRGEIAAGEKRRQLLDLLGNPRSGAFSRSGIPALLIDQAVPDLEAAANEVLSELSDGRMSVALRSQRETKAGSLSETLDIIVSDERGERDYSTFSGGEAMRVDLALRIGLSQLLARRAGARCEMLVCDETAAPLDVEGRRLFVECLGRVAQRFATVLCVSHLEEIKDLFPVRIEITKDEAGSHVEVLR